MGERVEGAGRGAWKRGQCVGRLIWVGGLTSYWRVGVGVGVGGVSILTFHVPPFPLTLPLSLCHSLSLFLYLSLSACVSQRFPWRPGGCGGGAAAAAVVEKQARA